MKSLALVMIVKDEAANIGRCLATARPYISNWTICDTGSTDGTQDLVRSMLGEPPAEPLSPVHLRDRCSEHDICMSDHWGCDWATKSGRWRCGLPTILGTFYQDDWQDFGQNRSFALARARGTADWLLLLDADMRVTIDPDFVPDPAVEAYMVEMGDPHGFSWRLPLLVRGDLPWVALGRVHAYVGLADRPFSRVNTDAVRIQRADSSSPAKTQRQAELLVADHAANPNDPRTMFYLAQTYRELGRNQEARTLYLRRAEMGGWPEEVYYAAYRAALLAPDWPTKQIELLAAWEMRPQRLEALCALCRGLNERGQHHAAYALASSPTGPCGDTLFVHRSVWDWGLKFERSISAWWVGHPEEARILCEELLVDPHLPGHIRAQVQSNRAYSLAA
jgi:glycosyltransferase involved in cell wall biosynthesis